MLQFEYTARDAAGAVRHGTIEAGDESVAMHSLRGQGYFITSLRPRRSAASLMPWWLTRGVPLSELAAFAFQLSALLAAGITLVRGLDILREETQHPRLRQVIAEVKAEIELGRSLSQAMEKHPAIFSSLFVGMVRSGEVSGGLDQAMKQLAELLDREVVVSQKVKAVFFYPAIVLAVTALVIGVFLIYVIPAFERVYRATGASLPLPTLVLVGLSQFVRKFALLILTAVVVGAWLVGRSGARHRIRPWLDTVLLGLPYLGRVMRLAMISRFVRILSTMLHSGIPILRALDVTADTVHQRFMRHALAVMKEEIKRGRRLRDAMEQSPLFPPTVLQMVALGEESGTLDEMLRRTADLLDRQAEYASNRMLVILEPLSTLVLGGVVGLILISLYLPIFGMSKAVLRR